MCAPEISAPVLGSDESRRYFLAMIWLSSGPTRHGRWTDASCSGVIGKKYCAYARDKNSEKGVRRPSESCGERALSNSKKSVTHSEDRRGARCRLLVRCSAYVVLSLTPSSLDLYGQSTNENLHVCPIFCLITGVHPKTWVPLGSICCRIRSKTEYYDTEQSQANQ
jgi:hypothetical protein